MVLMGIPSASAIASTISKPTLRNQFESSVKCERERDGEGQGEI